MSIRRNLVISAAAIAAIACAPATKQTTNAPLPRSTTTMTVINNHWSDVAVYLVSGPMRTRLGSVTAMGKGEFGIPRAYVVGVSEITVRADPLGSKDSFVSPPIQVFPGARVELNLAPRLAASYFAVYARY